MNTTPGTVPAHLMGMMMDISKIPGHVLDDIRSRGHSDEAIRRMSAKTAFTEYCEWNGLIHWGLPLFSAVLALKDADA